MYNRRRRHRPTGSKTLSCTLEQPIKFSEVDSMGVLWHGHYVRYFEDGREAWGRQYGLTYSDAVRAGFYIPVIDFACEHFAPLAYGDAARIEVTYTDGPAAKLLFDYAIYRTRDDVLAATGHSTQVFLNRQDRSLHLVVPAFFDHWKARHLND